jgi:6-phosphogluconolactonase
VRGTTHWQVFADAGQIAARAAALIVDSAGAAIAARGLFRIALAGGRTPLAVYTRLATAPASWSRWQVYFGDERCLPAGDPGRNDTEARRVWLDHVPIPAANVHAIHAEHGAEQAAAKYAELLRAVPDFDLVLLGLGEDGHTASLFPGRPLGEAPGSPDVLAVHDAPKPPPDRVSLSAARLARAQRVVFLVTGSDKRAAVTAWRGGADIPARHIAPAGDVEVWLDADADAN